MRQESLLASMPKLILVVVLIVGIGAVFGLMGYILTVPKSGVVINNKVEKEDIKKEEEKIQDEIADWKTYRNEEYGFEVKYPENWQVDENAIIGSPDAEGISFEKPEKWGFNFYNFGKVGDDDYKNLSILEDSNYDKNKEAINVGGVNTNLYMVKNPNDVQMGYPVDVTIRKNGNVYNINGFFNNSEDKEEFIKLLKNILSTFKFIEKSEKVTITYPTKDTVWEIGGTYQVQWQPSDLNNKIVIRLYKIPVVSLNLRWEPSNSIQNTGNYSFTVPKELEAGKYQFLIGGERSNEFSIVSK
jgi:hypothetical protein